VVDSPLAYAQAVEEAGGTPVILAPTDDDAVRTEYVRRLDGLVLSGGADIPPAAYGEKPHATVKVMPTARWEFESKLIDEWLATGKPVLGICLGTQAANVVRGGTLVQDLPSEVGGKVIHGKPPAEKGKDADAKAVPDEGTKKPEAAKPVPITHRVALAADSRLRAIFGTDELTVVSSHHQAVERLGRGLRAAAHSDDGVVEALELPDHPWAVFVQWHPERMDGGHRQTLFGALVRACRDAAGSKQQVEGSRQKAKGE
jgi:putative glutamine amidotransferase